MTERTETTLSEQGFLILLSLAEGPLHGYAILREVEDLSGGRLTISTGTLYGAIRRFLDSGWIRRAADPGAGTAVRDRQAYGLTREGQRVLEGEAERIESLARTARLRLGARTAAPARGGR